MIMSQRLSMKRERNHPEERISHKPGKDDKENEKGERKWC